MISSILSCSLFIVLLSILILHVSSQFISTPIYTLQLWWVWGVATQPSSTTNTAWLLDNQWHLYEVSLDNGNIIQDIKSYSNSTGEYYINRGNCLDIDIEGNFYICESGQGILKLSSKGEFQQYYPADTFSYNGGFYEISVSSISKDIFVCGDRSGVNNYIYRLNQAGKLLNTYTIENQNESCAFVYVSPNGTSIYYSAFISVYEIEINSGNIINQFDVPYYHAAGGISILNNSIFTLGSDGICQYSLNDTFLITNIYGTISEISQQGKLLNVWYQQSVPSFNTPLDLAIGVNDNIYITDVVRNVYTVSEYSLIVPNVPTLVSTYSLPDNKASIISIAVDSNSSVYGISLTDSTGSVIKWDKNGVIIKNASIDSSANSIIMSSLNQSIYVLFMHQVLKYDLELNLLLTIQLNDTILIAITTSINQSTEILWVLDHDNIIHTFTSEGKSLNIYPLNTEGNSINSFCINRMSTQILTSSLDTTYWYTSDITIYEITNQSIIGNYVTPPSFDMEHCKIDSKGRVWSAAQDAPGLAIWQWE